MLQVGEEVVYFSAVFALVLLGTRSAAGASFLTACLYVFMVMFRFPPVPSDQAGRVLRPGAPSGRVPVVAHRAGCHDAPENTLAAIREVRVICWECLQQSPALFNYEGSCNDKVIVTVAACVRASIISTARLTTYLSVKIYITELFYPPLDKMWGRHPVVVSANSVHCPYSVLFWWKHL